MTSNSPGRRRKHIAREWSPNWGLQIRTLREQCGMSLCALASAARVNKGNLSRIERGKSGLSWPTSQRIAKALGVPLYRLVPDCPSEDVLNLARSFALLDHETLEGIRDLLRRRILETMSEGQGRA